MLGGGLEYYEFIVFGVMVPMLGRVFFSSAAEPWLSTLQTLAIFAAGYIVSPVGGMFLSAMSDRMGRKHMFIVTVALMGMLDAPPIGRADDVEGGCALRRRQALRRQGHWEPGTSRPRPPSGRHCVPCVRIAASASPRSTTWSAACVKVLPLLAPVIQELALYYVAEQALGLPKSYCLA